MPKIYTRTGDEGTTSLFGGDRVAKTHPRIDAYGTVDETNAHAGLARAHLARAAADGPPTAEAPDADAVARLDDVLASVQDDLFVLGADLATPQEAKPVVPRITETHVAALEAHIDAFEDDLPALKHFVLPGGTEAAATLHVARTVCRRAERLVVEVAHLEMINVQAGVYLNRLSDLFFVLARWANHAAGVSEATWQPPASAGDANGDAS
jgi:cob(I)alamin adenosyltransferase